MILRVLDPGTVPEAPGLSTCRQCSIDKGGRSHRSWGGPGATPVTGCSDVVEGTSFISCRLTATSKARLQISPQTGQRMTYVWLTLMTGSWLTSSGLVNKLNLKPGSCKFHGTHVFSNRPGSFSTQTTRQFLPIVKISLFHSANPLKLTCESMNFSPVLALGDKRPWRSLARGYQSLGT
jgi:hypothetical protein